MAYLNKPMKFEEAIKRLKARKEIGSRLTSKQWAEVSASIRDRAFFSSRVASARFLQSAKRAIDDFLTAQREEVITPTGEITTVLKTGSRGDFINMMQEVAEREGMGNPLPQGMGKADQSMITQMMDVSSARRLGLIFETNLRSAYGYGNFQASVDPDVTETFPAWRFVRIANVKEPRPLHKKNEGVVRRKDDTKFWLEMNKKEIGGLGVPHGPWGFNSQMDVQEVDREEAVALGLIKPKERIRDPKSEFNKALSVDGSRMDKGIFGKLRKALGIKTNQKGWELKWAK